MTKDDLSRLPPLRMVAHQLRAHGYRVTIIAASGSQEVIEVFRQDGVDCLLAEGGSIGSNPIDKLQRWTRFHRSAWALLKANLQANDVLWVGGLETAVALGPQLRKYRYVLHLFELYDRRPVYRALMRSVLRGSRAVVVPEASRAAILRLWFKLPRTPWVIPNYSIQSTSEPYGLAADWASFVARRQLDWPSSLDAKKIILYQGHVDLRERPLLELARAARRLSDDFALVLLGHDHGALSQIRAVNPYVYYIPHIESPLHLKVTQRAWVGVCCYKFDSLNSIFCAPNKIWEYSQFGIPMLCNDVPGLINTVGNSRSGVCADFGDPDAVVSGILNISAEYDAFSRRSLALYSTGTMSRAFSAVIDSALGQLRMEGTE